MVTLTRSIQEMWRRLNTFGRNYGGDADSGREMGPLKGVARLREIQGDQSCTPYRWPRGRLKKGQAVRVGRSVHLLEKGVPCWLRKERSTQRPCMARLPESLHEKVGLPCSFSRVGACGEHGSGPKGSKRGG